MKKEVRHVQEDERDDACGGVVTVPDNGLADVFFGIFQMRRAEMKQAKDSGVLWVAGWVNEKGGGWIPVSFFTTKAQAQAQIREFTYPKRYRVRAYVPRDGR